MRVSAPHEDWQPPTGPFPLNEESSVSTNGYMRKLASSSLEPRVPRLYRCGGDHRGPHLVVKPTEYTEKPR